MPAQRNTQRKRGDFTGKQLDAAQEAQRKEQAARADSLTMISKVEEAEDSDAVYDPVSGNVIEESAKAQEVIEQLSDDPDRVEDLTNDPVNRAAKEEVVQTSAAEVLSDEEAKVRVRAAEDIDRMTVGVGTYYTMKMGRQYDVTRRVRDHMESKGLVWH